MGKKECEKKQVEELVCENCGGHFVYWKIKDNSLQCRKCGHVTPKEKNNA